MAEDADATNAEPAPPGAGAPTGKTRKCFGCKRIIPRELTKCPHCEREQGWGRILIWASAITTLIGVCSAGAGFYGMFDSWWPANVRVLLPICTQNRIVLKTINDGGQPATVGHPTFTIRSPRRNVELRMSAHVDNVPADAGVVGPDVPALQIYDARSIFFNPRESRGGACRIHVSVPVVPDRGTHPDVTKDCTCVYR